MENEETIESTKTAGFHPPPERLIANPKARLRDQFREVCRFKRLAERTEESFPQAGAEPGLEEESPAFAATVEKPRKERTPVWTSKGGTPWMCWRA
jgi:hypothetical protein